MLRCCCVSDKSAICIENKKNLKVALNSKAVIELRSSAVKIWMPAFCLNLLSIHCCFIPLPPPYFFIIIMFTTCYDRTLQQINRKPLPINQIHARLKSYNQICLHNTRIKIYSRFLFVTYTIIRNITSSEMSAVTLTRTINSEHKIFWYMLCIMF